MTGHGNLFSITRRAQHVGRAHHFTVAAKCPGQLQAIDRLRKSINVYEHSQTRKNLSEAFLNLDMCTVLRGENKHLYNGGRQHLTEKLGQPSEFEEYVQQQLGPNAQESMRFETQASAKDCIKNVMMSLYNAFYLNVNIQSFTVNVVFDWVRNNLKLSTRALDDVLRDQTLKSDDKTQFFDQNIKHRESSVKASNIGSEKSCELLSIQTVCHFIRIYLQWVGDSHRQAMLQNQIPDIFRESIPFFLRHLAIDGRLDMNIIIEILRLAVMYKRVVYAKSQGYEIQKKNLSCDTPLLHLYTSIADRIVIIYRGQNVSPSSSLYILSTFLGEALDMSSSIFSRSPPILKTMYLYIMENPTNEVDLQCVQKIVSDTEKCVVSQSSHPILEETLQQIVKHIHSYNDSEYIKIVRMMKRFLRIRAPPPTYTFYSAGESASSHADTYGEYLGNLLYDAIKQSCISQKRSSEVYSMIKITLQSYEEAKAEKKATESLHVENESSFTQTDGHLTNIEAILHGIRSSSQNILEETSVDHLKDHEISQSNTQNNSTQEHEDASKKYLTTSKLFRISVHSLHKFLNDMFDGLMKLHISGNIYEEITKLRIQGNGNHNNSPLYDRCHENNNGLEDALRVVLRGEKGAPFSLNDLLGIAQRVLAMSCRIYLCEEKLQQVSPHMLHLRDIGVDISSKLLFLIRNRVLFSHSPLSKNRDFHASLVECLRKENLRDILMLIQIAQCHLLRQSHARLTQSVLDASYASVFIPMKAIDGRPRISCPIRIHQFLWAFDGYKLSPQCTEDTQKEALLPQVDVFYTSLFNTIVKKVDMQNLDVIFQTFRRNMRHILEDVGRNNIRSKIADEYIGKGRVDLRNCTMSISPNAHFEIFFDATKQFASILANEVRPLERDIVMLNPSFVKLQSTNILQILSAFAENCRALRSLNWYSYLRYPESMFKSEMSIIHHFQDTLHQFAPSIDGQLHRVETEIDEAAIYENHKQIQERIGSFVVPQQVRVLSRLASPESETILLEMLKAGRRFLFSLCSPLAKCLEASENIALSDKQILTLSSVLLELWSTVFSSPLSSFARNSYYEFYGDTETLRSVQWEAMQNEECERRVMSLFFARAVRQISKTGVFAQSGTRPASGVAYTIPQMCDVIHMIAQLEYRRTQRNQKRLQEASHKQGLLCIAHYNREFKQFFSTHQNNLGIELPQPPSLVSLFATLIPVLEMSIYLMDLRQIQQVLYAFYVFRSPNKRVLDAILQKLLDLINTTGKKDLRKFSSGKQKRTSALHFKPFEKSGKVAILPKNNLQSYDMHRFFVDTFPPVYFIAGYQPIKNFSIYCFQVLASFVRKEGVETKDCLEILKQDILEELSDSPNDESSMMSSLRKKHPCTHTSTTFYPNISSIDPSDKNGHSVIPYAINPPWNPLHDIRAMIGPFFFAHYAPHTVCMVLHALPSILRDVQQSKKCAELFENYCEIIICAALHPFVVGKGKRSSAYRLPLLRTSATSIVNFMDGLLGLVQFFGQNSEGKLDCKRIEQILLKTAQKCVEEIIMQLECSRGLTVDKKVQQEILLPFLQSADVLRSIANVAMALDGHMEGALLPRVYKFLYYIFENDSDQWNAIDLQSIKEMCSKAQAMLSMQTRVS